MNKLIVFNNWKDLQNAVNEIGWENFKLYNSWKRNHAWKRNGHLVMNINVYNEDTIYLGFIYEDELSAICNIYVENNEMHIGDFEVSKFKTHKGIGKLFFNEILNKFPNCSVITLTYLNKDARLFWEKMGFIGNDKNKIMILNMDKQKIYESIMAKIAVEVKRAILESEDLSDVETKWSPREGLFKEDDPEKIVRSLVRSSKDYNQAMKRLTFYMNRAGENLKNKTVLNKAKQILHDKIENECIEEGECPGGMAPAGPGPQMPYNTPMNTPGMGEPMPPHPGHPGSGDIFKPVFPVFVNPGIYNATSKKKRKKSKRKSRKTRS